MVGTVLIHFEDELEFSLMKNLLAYTKCMIGQNESVLSQNQKIGRFNLWIIIKIDTFKCEFRLFVKNLIFYKTCFIVLCSWKKMQEFTQRKCSSFLNMSVTKIFKFLFEQELGDLRKSDVKYFRNIQVDESNILLWQGLIVPVSIAYRHI